LSPYATGTLCERVMCVCDTVFVMRSTLQVVADNSCSVLRQRKQHAWKL